MNSNLMPILSSISKLPIDTFQIDTKNDVIKLNFISDDKQGKIKEIIFNEVTSFYYLDHDKKSDETIKQSLNNIMYVGYQASDYINAPEDESNISIPNFIIELNDSNMFIEANSIVIDSETYMV
ncbi:MAG: hypothetical protein JXR88_05570 [Clostridia bacterium]|nr:hypothetical protein [Clostridia bacterium]